MKKIMLLTLALVLAFSAVAMAADVKVGGDLRYRFRWDMDNAKTNAADVGRTYVTNWLSFDVKVNDKVGGYFELDNVGLGDYAGKNDQDLGAYAYITYAPGNGLPTFQFGKISEGSSVLVINSPSSLFWAGDGVKGVGVSGEVAGISYNGFFAPGFTSTLPAYGIQGSYDLKVAKVGGAFFGDTNVADPKAGYAVQASVPVPFGANTSVYAELGKKANEAGDFSVFGAGTTVATVAVNGELDTINQKAAFSATVPVDGLKFNVSYTMPTVSKDNAKYTAPVLTSYVRISF
ncbi:MAG: hypothetical protein ACM3RP_09245 [Chitinophagales bacterium]